MAASLRLGCQGIVRSFVAGLRSRGRESGLRLLHTAERRWGAPPVQVFMPALSPTMEEGNIVKWLKKEGEPVNAGDALCDIETDKAVVTMESSEDGVLAKIMVQEGSRNVRLGSLIALLVDEGQDWKQVEIPSIQCSSPPDVTKGHHKVASSPPGKLGVRMSPAARHILNTHGVDPQAVVPSGPRGIITKEDALRVVAQKTPEPTATQPGTPTPVVPRQPTPPPSSIQRPSHPPISIPGNPLTPGTFSDIPTSDGRKAFAKSLTAAKSSVPHTYTSLDCDLAALLHLRTRLAKGNIRVSINDFIIKATAVTLRQMPEVNVTWSGEALSRLDSYDVSFVVATDTGPVTAVIRQADSMGMQEIAETAKVLAQKARDGKLSPEENLGGSICISNLGMLGVSGFSGSVEPPQCLFLAVGSSRTELHLCDDEEGTPRIRQKQLLNVTLSSDVRVINNELASMFLSRLRDNIENPGACALV